MEAEEERGLSSPTSVRDDSIHDEEEEDDTDSIDKELDWLIEKAERTGKPEELNGKDEVIDLQRTKTPEPAKSDERAKINGGDDYDDYVITDDQRLALIELQKMKDDMDDYPDDDPPEYDVAARVKQLNEELANEPEPDAERQRKVVFKENIIDLVAPPPDYSDDEDHVDDDDEVEDEVKDDNGDKGLAKSNNSVGISSGVEESCPEGATGKDGSGDSSDLGVERLTLDENQQKRESEESEKVAEDGKSKTKSGKAEDKVLIERDGKFELISSTDVRAQDLGLPMLAPELDDQNANNSNSIASEEQDSAMSSPSSSSSSTSLSSSSSSSGRGSHKPTPPSKPRPNTASGATRRTVRVTPQKRVHSAGSTGRFSSALEGFSYRSPYAMSDELKDLQQQRQHARMERERALHERHREEEERKQEENDEAFQAWLKNKKESQTQRHKEDRSQGKKGSKRDEQKEEEALSYSAWLQSKRQQHKREKQEEIHKRQEIQDGYFIRARDECDKAFRAWLKRKNMESRSAKAAYKKNERIHKLQARKSRKSQQLFRAIRDAQSYKYVDYYGYRY